jgi:uncharacterized 2Fe-2S/4Fe-4S cluster protein (DUF4445 family)
MVLGMIPDCALDHVHAAGNAASTGARIALLNLAARAEIERVVRQVEKIETAVEPNFQAHFVAAIAIPNAIDSFPNLSQAVTLPAPKKAQADEGGRRRRRSAAPATGTPGQEGSA